MTTKKKAVILNICSVLIFLATVAYWVNIFADFYIGYKEMLIETADLGENGDAIFWLLIGIFIAIFAACLLLCEISGYFNLRYLVLADEKPLWKTVCNAVMLVGAICAVLFVIPTDLFLPEWLSDEVEDVMLALMLLHLILRIAYGIACAIERAVKRVKQPLVEESVDV